MLTAILGHCDLALLKLLPGQDLYAEVAQIRENGNRAAALVGQLLAFARRQKLHPETIDLNEILYDLQHLLNRLVGERVRIRLTAETEAFASVDRRNFEQVVMNLVVNARDAMPMGGEISLILEHWATASAQVFGRAKVPPGQYISLQVIDQGNGIEPGVIDQVFEPFFTTKPIGDGTGLGLSTAYGIVKQMGGFKLVESAVDRGSVFRVLFPEIMPPFRSSAERPASGIEHLRPSRDLEGRSFGTVLFAEDDAPVRAFGSRALRLSGFKVVEVSDGREALEVIGGIGADLTLIVSDVVMPEMDGPTWVSQALVNYPGLPVLFVSGYSREEYWEYISSIPNARFLAKPFSLAELRSEALQVVSGEGGSDN